LFKEFLNDKLNSTKPREFIDKLFHKVFEYFNRKNDETNAIKYLQKSSDLKLAIPIITGRFTDLFEKGEYEILWNWISNMDDTTASMNADLLFFKARLLQFYKGEIDGSLPYLEKAIKLYRDKNDIESYLRHKY
jgi:ATP/maltotriose-dependent transcriptional regulator MalT